MNSEELLNAMSAKAQVLRELKENARKKELAALREVPLHPTPISLLLASFA